MCATSQTTSVLPFLFYTKNWHADFEFACKVCFLVVKLEFTEIFLFENPFSFIKQITVFFISNVRFMVWWMFQSFVCIIYPT